MGKLTYHGKPKSYPYYFVAYQNGQRYHVSGTFKHKIECRNQAKHFSRINDTTYKVRDRRK